MEKIILKDKMFAGKTDFRELLKETKIIYVLDIDRRNSSV